MTRHLVLKRSICIRVSWVEEAACHEWDQASRFVGSNGLAWGLTVHVAMLGVAVIRGMQEVSLPI